MARRVDEPTPGILVIDKPSGMTSHDVVSRVRRLGRTRKVGHAGTLDPMATGVLVIGVGKATRLLTWVSGHSKGYEATVRLGVTTSTEDAEGEATSLRGAREISAGEWEAAMASLRGEIMQIPSAVSAIKIDGKRAYARVRDGETVEIPARPVTIFSLETVGEMCAGEAEYPFPRSEIEGEEAAELREHPLAAEENTPAGERVRVPVIDVDIRVECSSGTYVRALARDLGEALGCGAHLTALRRTHIENFTLESARSLETLMEDERQANDGGEDYALPLMSLDEATLRMFPPLHLNEQETEKFRHGNAPLRRGDDYRLLREAAGEDPLAVVGADGAVKGLARCEQGKIRTVLVF